MKRKIILLLIVFTYSIQAFAQKPTTIQINYTLNQLAQRIHDKQAGTIIPMLSNEFRISFYDPLASKSVLTQLINQMPNSTITFGQLTESNGSYFAKGILMIENASVPFMVKMNEFLEFDRIGLFETLLKQTDPVINANSTAVLETTLPIDVSASMIFINIKLSGYEKPLRFLFDSGAGVTAIDSAAAIQFGIPINTSQTMVRSASGQYGNYPTITNPTFVFGKTKVETSHAIVSNLSTFSKIYGVEIDGIIGYDLLRDHLVEVDLDNNQFNIYRGSQINWAAGNAVKLPITLSNNTPKVNIAVQLPNKEVEGMFMFDTGASSSIIFNTYFNMLHGVSAQLKKPLKTIAFDIAGNPSKNIIGTIPAVAIGDEKIPAVAASVNVQSPGSPVNTEEFGILGMGIIKKFNILFNYPTGTIELIPNQLFKEPMTQVYLLGMGTYKEADKFIIKNLNVDGIAFKSGLRNGDEVLSINNTAIKTMNEVISQLKLAEKQDLTFTLLRNGEKISLTIKKLK